MVLVCLHAVTCVMHDLSEFALWGAYQHYGCWDCRCMIPRILRKLGSMAPLNMNLLCYGICWGWFALGCVTTFTLQCLGLMPANMCAYARQRHKARRTSHLLVILTRGLVWCLQTQVCGCLFHTSSQSSPAGAEVIQILSDICCNCLCNQSCNQCSKRPLSLGIPVPEIRRCRKMSKVRIVQPRKTHRPGRNQPSSAGAEAAYMSQCNRLDDQKSNNRACSRASTKMRGQASRTVQRRHRLPHSQVLNLGLRAPLLHLRTVPVKTHQIPRPPPVRGRGLSPAQQLLHPRHRHSRMSTKEQLPLTSQQPVWCRLCKAPRVLRDVRAVHRGVRLHKTPPVREVQGNPPEREASKSPKTDLSLHGNPMLHRSGEQTAPPKKALTVTLHRWGGSGS